jgi:hypothetical protein
MEKNENDCVTEKRKRAWSAQTLRDYLLNQVNKKNFFYYHHFITVTLAG